MMTRIFFVFTIAIVISCSQKETKKQPLQLKAEKVQLGDSLLYLMSSVDQAGDVVLLNLHENEQTALHVMISIGKKDSLPFLFLHQNQQRRIAFNLMDTLFSADPNRIFTNEGRIQTLKDSMSFSNSGVEYIDRLSQQILLRVKNAKWVIALHNNTDENYSINSYLSGGSEVENTGDVYVNDRMDGDDFIYTTNPSVFEFLKKEKVNVILQSETHFVDDGSLSVYCAQNGIDYINIETQHGHFAKQMEFMRLLAEYLQL